MCWTERVQTVLVKWVCILLLSCVTWWDDLPLRESVQLYTSQLFLFTWANESIYFVISNLLTPLCVCVKYFVLSPGLCRQWKIPEILTYINQEDWSKTTKPLRQICELSVSRWYVYYWHYFVRKTISFNFSLRYLHVSQSVF